MQDRRPPWWIHVVDVSFLVFAGLVCYTHFFGPEQPGWDVISSESGLRIQAVQPGSAAARAGQEPRDCLLNWDGLPVSAFFIRVRLWHVEIGRSYRLEIERGCERRTIPLIFGRQAWSFWLQKKGLTPLANLTSSALCLVLAFVVAFARPYDIAARWGALCLAELAAGLMHVSFWELPGGDHTIQNLPAGIGACF